MTDMFKRIERLRRRFKNLDDDDLRVFDTARRSLTAAVAEAGVGGDTIFGDEVDAELALSAQHGIDSVMKGADPEWLREDFWEQARRLGFGREDEHWDYEDASPPPEMLKRLLEVQGNLVARCADLMVADGLVKVWVDIDADGYREGKSTPHKLHPEGYYFVAERRVLRMQAATDEASEDSASEPVDVADWYAIAVCHLNAEGVVVVEPISYGLDIEGKACHRISGDVALVLEKFGLENLESPMVAPKMVEEVLSRE